MADFLTAYLKKEKKKQAMWGSGVDHDRRVTDHVLSIHLLMLSSLFPPVSSEQNGKEGPGPGRAGLGGSSGDGQLQNLNRQRTCTFQEN